jgi:formate dehydrogenase (coenzyme F420) beta subunit
MKDKVREWLETGKVDLFLGYRKVDGHPLPHAFTKENFEELEELIISPARYPLEKLAGKILAIKPSFKIGILGRNCNQRAVNVLTVHHQITPGQIEIMEVNCCPSPLQEHADCSSLEPRPYGEVKLALGIDNNMSVARLEQYDQETLFSKWMYEFQKCLKCYGCRDICPVCFCKECSLEHGDLIETGGLPPEVPLFHLVRAVHMAGRCIDCGLCEEACPVDIPLRLLYRKVNGIVKDLFGYETGVSHLQPPFSILGESAPTEGEALP